jgi:hypothetical protein
MSTTEQVTPLEPLLPKADNYLGSWKEIAVHLKREVRTVQRWEKHEGLPVRRHSHRNASTVYAYKDEINKWIQSRKPITVQTNKPVKVSAVDVQALKQFLTVLRVCLDLLDSQMGVDICKSGPTEIQQLLLVPKRLHPHGCVSDRSVGVSEVE